MVNALFDHSSSSGSSGSSVDAIQVSAGVASLSTEEFDIVDTSDSGIVMSVSRTNGVDINADTTIHTPVSGMVPLMITDSNNNVVVRVNQDSTLQSVDATITRSVFNLVSGVNLYTGANKLIMSTAPSGYTLVDIMRYFRSRLQIGVHYNFWSPAVYPTLTPTNFITLQGGMKGNTSGSQAYGELCIEDKNNVYMSNVSKIGEMVVLHWTYASNGSGTGPKEAVLGIHTTTPTACVHIQNRADTMVPFRIDNTSGTQILSLDNSGNLTLAGTLTSSGGGSSSMFTTNLTMPTTYTASPNAASPTQYQLGYCKEVKNSTTISMAANTVTTMAQIDITTGVWMIHAVAVFSPGSGVSTLGAAVSGTTGVINR